jgi:dolichol kinase
MPLFSIQGNEESILWLIILAIACCIGHEQATTVMIGLVTLSALIQGMLLPQESTVWRNPTGGDSQGLVMSCILLPVVVVMVSSPTNMDIICFYVAVDMAVPMIPPLFRNYIGHHMACFQGVFTKGEFKLVVTLGGMVLLQGLAWRPSHNDDVYISVAVTGVAGCLLGCILASMVPSLLFRVPILVGTPLLMVEWSLHYTIQQQYPIPICGYWLVEFLSQQEGPYPRYYVLVYWAVMLVLLLPASPTSSAPVVVARKWFHLIAIILFAPPTYYQPQFLSLAYAIALCVLMVVEHCRSQLPMMEFYYSRYLDIDKDSTDRVVISHMSLIVGCAIPCWMSLITGKESILLLRLFGILVLGVGDSMAALVGTQYGKTKWGRRRSVEGSVAMWISMGGVCCRWGLQLDGWVAVVTFTTILEAFTCQIDNLVLPLAGATILLLQDEWLQQE